ncbi:Uncharacterized protein dnm_071520 [Desulfonema magnum]|uniref:Uncharacterized protein n=1 Tax=Desulfonema magnum TaxID=45655 RepID=A0A975BSU4_9BACT|nr:Uncharacterized protein dnm_071520 [Desulfonema magnum]
MDKDSLNSRKEPSFSQQSGQLKKTIKKGSLIRIFRSPYSAKSL